MNDTCETCAYARVWYPFVNERDRGVRWECRRYPPSHSDEPSAMKNDAKGFPEIDRWDWCGEWSQYQPRSTMLRDLPRGPLGILRRALWSHPDIRSVKDLRDFFAMRGYRGRVSMAALESLNGIGPKRAAQILEPLRVVFAEDAASERDPSLSGAGG